MTFIFSPRQHEVQRGNVVLVEGSDQPHMVARYDYRRGVQVAPYTGPINSRRRQRRVAGTGVARPVEWDARWIQLADVTHVATGRR